MVLVASFVSVVVCLAAASAWSIVLGMIGVEQGTEGWWRRSFGGLVEVSESV